MFAEVKKDAVVNTPHSSGSLSRAFNSTNMMTRSQLTASARTLRTPLRGLPTIGRGHVISPVMFHHEDSPYTTHRTAATNNVTFTSQGLEVALEGSRGG